MCPQGLEYNLRHLETRTDTILELQVYRYTHRNRMHSRVRLVVVNQRGLGSAENEYHYSAGTTTNTRLHEQDVQLERIQTWFITT